MATATAVFALLLAGFATLLDDARTRARTELSTRFEVRTEMAGDSVAAWVDDQLDRQAGYATRVLAQPDGDRSPADAAAAFDFGAVEIAPGVAAAGVSALIDEAGGAVLVFEVPFEQDGTPAVFRGRVRAADTTLPRLLAQAMPIKGRQIHLVDGTGTVLASNAVQSGTRLADAEPTLAAAMDASRSTASMAGTEHRVDASAVRGTPWRVVAAAPSALLFQPVDEVSSAPWLLFGAFAVVGVIALVLLWWITREHAHLTATSRRDDATGLYNRGHAEERVAEIVAAARRHRRPWSAILIDIDRFKAINDALGHHVGDVAIHAVAEHLQHSIRTEDIAARWGGDEFLLLLPETTAAQAVEVAERIRTAVEIAAPLGRDQPVTLSLGVASTVDESGDDVIVRADGALYEAKRAGRNRTALGTPTEVTVDLVGATR